MSARKQLVLACLSIMAIAVSTPARSQQTDTAMIADQNGCKHVNPNPQPEERLTWSGGCKDGLAEGEGVIEWFLGDKLVERYEGAYKRGKPDGSGVLVSTQQGYYRYEGDWKDGAPNGSGKVTLPDGSVYTGQVKDWKFHGKGELVLPDGSSQAGNWSDGELAQPLEKL